VLWRLGNVTAAVPRLPAALQHTHAPVDALYEVDERHARILPRRDFLKRNEPPDRALFGR
jgi:hypothetical protein